MTGEFARRLVTVMGLGRFGGGIGVTRWLAGRGAEVIVTDLADADALAPALAAIADLVDDGAVRLRLGGHRVDDFTGCDLVVANPAVPRPWENDLLRAAAVAGVPVTTEIRLLVERLSRDRIIGVTGTAGKSTTTAMIHHVLEGAGLRAHRGGNIGGSLLGRLDEVGPDDRVVLELSSFMLHWLGAGAGAPDAAGFSPHVAVWTNLAPNHLDWHGSHEHYERSKRNIFAAQRAGDHAIRGDELEDAGGAIPLLVPGAHNRRNAITALAAVHAATGLPPHETAPRLGDFTGLPHRLRLVAEHVGRRFYDDSKSTTPEAAVLAVAAFPEAERVHLIAGGYDKGADLGGIADMAPRLGGLYTIGATGGAIAAAAAGDAATSCGTLDVAVERAVAAMREGDVLLLSPGCASWDQFENFEARGARFVELVRAMAVV
jgi:UDP-N-acetylmuramoylalanine--D-glutamate ligase